MPDFPSIVPTFRYREPAKMIDWLERAFGFTTRVRYGDGDNVEHAEIAFDGALVIVGSVRDDAYGRIVGEPGPGNGSSLYVVTDDPDALFERAKAAGATIEQGLTDRDYGSREFIARDPEGFVWCFGTYRPELPG